MRVLSSLAYDKMLAAISANTKLSIIRAFFFYVGAAHSSFRIFRKAIYDITGRTR